MHTHPARHFGDREQLYVLAGPWHRDDDSTHGVPSSRHGCPAPTSSGRLRLRVVVCTGKYI
jgi:hypothetical protein